MGSGKKGKGDPNASHAFWDNQPVPKLGDVITDEFGPIERKTVDQVQKEPYTLPKGYEWSDINMNDEKECDEIYELLSQHYVEDDDNMFRFNYSKNFLRWALKAPGYKRMWHCGIRSTVKSKKLLACITAIPASVQVYKDSIEMVEINFLCVHKKLRSKRLAPVLIKEITRRVNIRNIWQAAYTAGVVIPKPVARNQYWHRSINPKKLIEVKFSHLSRNMTMQRHLKLYKLPETTKTPGIRDFKTTDVEAVTVLLNTYLEKFDLTPIFTAADVLHWFIPQKDIIESYVVEDPNEPGNITDFVSFYTLPSTVMNHPQHDNIKAAYSFYNVSTATPWPELMGDALVLAKKNNFDVFNALDLMENSEFLEKLKFGIGDGNLQYYLYNWKCPKMDPKKIGLVLQ